MITALKTNYALRGAIGFGIPALLLFGLSFNTLLSAFLCGVIGSMAYRPHTGRLWLPLLLGVSFTLVQGMFLLHEPPSLLLSDVVWTGLTSAFVFWVVGAGATLALPADRRFNGAGVWAIAGGLGGMAFQLVRGWSTGREHLVLWLIVSAVGGWLFGSQLNTAPEPYRNRWAIASVVCGFLGLGIGAAYLGRYALPLGLRSGFSPASQAADWLWSWGLLTAAIGTIGVFRKNQGGGGMAGLGISLAFFLILSSARFEGSFKKVEFNTEYGRKLLATHRIQADPRQPYAIYTGNLILAQAALDRNDDHAAGRFLLAAAKTPGLPQIAENGPDMSVAAVLLQRGQQESVIEYLRLSRTLWPKGIPVLERWETAISSGRRVNFNNRAINPVRTDRFVIGQ